MQYSIISSGPVLAFEAATVSEVTSLRAGNEGGLSVVRYGASGLCILCESKPRPDGKLQGTQLH
jgi:hypothetical protein